MKEKECIYIIKGFKSLDIMGEKQSPEIFGYCGTCKEAKKYVNELCDEFFPKILKYSGQIKEINEKFNGDIELYLTTQPEGIKDVLRSDWKIWRNGKKQDDDWEYVQIGYEQVFLMEKVMSSLIV